MTKNPAKDNKRIKRIIELLFFIPLIIIALVLYYFIDKEVSKRMGILKADILEYIEKQLGRKIQYESISPSIFMYLEIRDLRIVSFVSYEDEIFRIRKIKIKYNIFNLLFQEDPLSSVSEINISNTLFKFGLTPGQNSDRTDFQRTFLEKLTSTRYSFEVTANNIGLLLYTETMLINCTNLFFKIKSTGKTYDINLRKGTVRFTINEQNSEPLWFFSKLKIKGLFSGDFNKADLIVHILNLSSNNFVLNKQTFQVILKDDKLNVVKIQDKAPVDVRLSLDLKTQEFVCDFESENWKPSSMLKLTGPLFGFNPWLNSSITSTGKISYNLTNDSIDYTLSSKILLNNPIIPPDIVVSTYLYGDREIAYFQPLVVHSNLGTIDFTGNILFKNFFPEGFLRLANVKAIQDKRISADFTLDRNEESLSLKGSRLYIGTSGFDMFNLDIFPDFSSLFFKLSASFAQSEYNNLVYAEGAFIIDPSFAVHVNGSFNDIPVSNVYRLFTPDSVFSVRVFDFLKSLAINSDFMISSDFKATNYNTNYFLVQDQENSENRISLNMHGTEQEIFIDSIKAGWETYDVKGNVHAKILGKGNISFLSNIYLEGIPYGISGYYTHDKMLIVKGNYGLNIEIHFRKKDDVIVAANALKLPFPISGVKKEVAYTSFSISGILPEDGNWQIVSPSTIFYDLPVFRVRKNECELAFILNKQELYLSEIQYKDFLSELSGYGIMRLGGEENFYISGDALLTGRKTEELYSLSVYLNPYSINSHLNFANCPLERIGEHIVTGSLSGSMTFSGQLLNPDINGNISLVKGSLVGDHVGLQADFRIKGPEVSFNNFTITYLDLKIDEGKGMYNKENGPFQFSAVFEGDYFRKSIRSDISLTGSTFNMNPNDFFDKAFEREYTARFDFSGITVDNSEYDPWSLFLNKKADVLNVNGGPEDVLSGIFLKNGEFEIEIKDPFPIQGLARGNVKKNTIDSVIERIRIDLNVLNVILGEDVIRFTQGYATGENIKISGYFHDPDFNGNLLAQNVKFSFFLCPFETKPLKCNLLFNEKQLEMEQNTVQVGSGYVYVDKGIFYFDHWLPSAYDLTFRSDNDIGLYCSYDFKVVKVNGYAIGTVIARGDFNTVLVNGKLTVHYCTITMSNPPETEDSGTEDDIDMKINLAFKSGRKVEFDWPTTNFPVLKCYAEKGSEVLISYDTNLEVFNMNGEVAIKGGEVFYFNRNFYLKSGNIVFNVVNPDEFDPSISVRAELREYDYIEKEDIKIYLIAENNRLSEFSPRFESIPSLSEHRIYELLGQSLEKRFNEDRDIGVSLVLLSSEVLSEAFIFRTFEQTVREIFNLDLFSIRTHIIENVLIDKVLGEVEDQPDSNPISLGKYLDNTTITIGQYLGDDLFVSALVRLREVDYYSPETLFGSGFFGIEPELEFSLEWPTPFFNLEWTFNPTQEHLKELFFYLTDNTIKFEWSFSY